jgi:hypothetical protein
MYPINIRGSEEMRMSDKLMSQKVTKVGLVFAALGVAGGAIFAAFLANNNTPEDATLAQPYTQSISIESEVQKETPKIEDTHAAIDVVPEAVNNTKISSEEIILELVEGSDALPSNIQKITNGSKKVQATPAPSTSSGPKPSKPAETVEEPGLIFGEPGSGTISTGTDCPATRAENPAIYDACRAGFVAPTLEWAGYHSCKRVSEDIVDIYGLVRISGGNYSHISNTGPITNGMISVKGRNDTSPYGVMWYIEAVFWSMDSRYDGIIHKMYVNGSEFISEDQLDPSCRL